MAPYARPDSPFWWLCLERPGQKPIRERTAIVVNGGTPTQTKLNAVLAQQAYAVRMGELARNRYQLAVEKPVITFAKYRAWYEQHVSSTKRGRVRERSILAQLGKFFDPMGLHTIATKDVIEWRTYRTRDGKGAGTVNRELSLLKHVLGTAVPEYLDANPASGVKLLRVPEQDVRLLEPDEERRLLAVCTPEERAIVICALDTLQRLGTIARLQRAQDHGAYLTVLNPKVKGYKVPVSVRLRAALDALPANGPGFFHLSNQRLGDRFRDLLKRADLPGLRKAGGLSFHSLRHTGASRMLARGVDIETVRQLGGWRNLITLQKYLHPTDAQKRAAVEAVSSVNVT